MRKVLLSVAAITCGIAGIFVACDNDDPLPVKGSSQQTVSTANNGSTTTGIAAASTGAQTTGATTSQTGATTSDLIKPTPIITPHGDTVFGTPAGMPGSVGTTTSGSMNQTTAGAGTTSSTGSTTNLNLPDSRGFVTFNVNGVNFTGGASAGRIDNGVFTLRTTVNGTNFPFVNLNAVVGSATSGIFSSTSSAANSGVFGEFPGTQDVVFTSGVNGGSATITFASISRGSASGSFSFTGISTSGEQRNVSGNFEIFFQ